MNAIDLSPEVLRRAADLKEQQNQIQQEIDNLLGGNYSGQRVFQPIGTRIITTKTGVKRTMSPETIAKMREAQQRRWTKVHAAQAAQATQPAVTEQPVVQAAPTPPVTEAPVNPPQASTEIPAVAPQKGKRGKSERAALIAA